MKQRILPRTNWVLIKPQKPQTENEFGLSIPDQAEKEKKAIGEILELGPHVDKDLMRGDRVIFGVYAGENLQLLSKQLEKDKVDYKLIHEEEIIAILEDI